MNVSTVDNFHTSIAPWLTISKDAKAIEFYKSAFVATEVYRYDSQTGGSVVRLSVPGAEFWVSEETGGRGVVFAASRRKVSPHHSHCRRSRRAFRPHLRPVPNKSFPSLKATAGA